jgi:hypothetical protein
MVREVSSGMSMTQVARNEDQARPFPLDSTPRGWRLDVVRELLADLDTITLGGVTFTMAKVVGLLHHEVDAAGPALSELQRRAMKRALHDLTREHDRLLPDTVRFVVRTRAITETLASV